MDPNNYNPNKNRPLEKRSCTDCVCLVSFIVFLVSWVILANFAYQNSNLDTSPTDDLGQMCGFNKNVSDRKDLFFFDLSECVSPMVIWHGCTTPKVCVKKCPTEDWSVIPVLEGKEDPHWPTIRQKLICKSPDDNNHINSMETLKNYTASNTCAKYYIKSKQIFHYCLPLLNRSSEDIDRLKNFMKENNIVLSNVIDGVTLIEWWYRFNDNAMLMVDDLKNNYTVIVFGLLIGLVFSLAYILLLRWFGWMIIWISLLAVLILVGFGFYGSFTQFISFQDPADNMKSDNIPIDLVNGGRQNLFGYIDSKLNTKGTWLAATIVTGVVFVILSLIIVFLRSRISLSIAIIVEGSRAIQEIKTSLLFPLFQWLMYAAVLVWFLGVAFFLMSSRTILFKVKDLQNDSDCICDNDYMDGDWCTVSKWERHCMTNQTHVPCKLAKCDYSHSVTQDFMYGLQLFNFFGLFWLWNFVTAFSQMVLGIAFASWYWTFCKRDVPFFSLTQSVYKTIRYHLGTIAFGSLIIAACNFIRAILVYLETKLKKYDNDFTRCVFKCMHCFFWLLNKFLRFINRNAYIMCAIYGKNFYTSAKQAFDLLLRNILRIVVLDKVSEFIFFVGKVVITGCTMVVFYYEFYDPLFTPIAFVDKPPALNYTWLPITVVAVGSWWISATFFHVYSVAVDTLFLCFLEDSERNDGSVDRPYFMSQKLMNILGAKNVNSARTRTCS